METEATYGQIELYGGMSIVPWTKPLKVDNSVEACLKTVGLTVIENHVNSSRVM